MRQRLVRKFVLLMYMDLHGIEDIGKINPYFAEKFIKLLKIV